jgi:hypothetical protein
LWFTWSGGVEKVRDYVFARPPVVRELPRGQLACRLRYYCPVPVSVAVCGLLGALSLTCSVALYVALLFGENTTLMLHEEPAANVLVQVRD